MPRVTHLEIFPEARTKQGPCQGGRHEKMIIMFGSGWPGIDSPICPKMEIYF